MGVDESLPPANEAWGKVMFTGRNEVLAKVIFLHLYVILFTGEDLPQCMLGYHPPGSDTSPPGPGRHPPDQVDTPPGPGRPPRTRQTPWARQTPPDQADTPRPGRPPRPGRTPWEADSSIWSMSSWYASYWNAFLFYLCLSVILFTVATEVGGTHPTGMHTCFKNDLKI